MAFIRQTWALCEKTLTIVFMRHWLGTLLRAFLAPIIYMFFIAFAKNFFVPPSDFGIGVPSPIRSLSNAVASSAGGRNTFVFVDNGFTGGPISSVIDRVSQPIVAQGKPVHTVSSAVDLLRVCPSSIRGTSTCFAAVVFESSPTEGPDGVWNYTIRADGALGGKVFVNSRGNDAEIYVLPVQHAVDDAIASLNNTSLPDNIQEYPYTSQTPKQRQQNITRQYMGALIDILGVAYFVGIVGICYQLTGQMALERELGMSQLIEAMMPNRQRWVPQAARLLSIHISFDILYLPSWIVMACKFASIRNDRKTFVLILVIHSSRRIVVELSTDQYGNPVRLLHSGRTGALKLVYCLRLSVSESPAFRHHGDNNVYCPRYYYSGPSGAIHCTSCRPQSLVSPDQLHAVHHLGSILAETEHSRRSTIRSSRRTLASGWICLVHFLHHPDRGISVDWCHD